MPHTRNSYRVAFLGDYPPRRCGVATFTKDLRCAVASLKPQWQCSVLALTDPGRDYEYPLEVRFEIPEPDIQSYVRAADFLNLSHTDVLCVQHEFGIYGGRAGSHVLALMRRARIPIITTLHTILQSPNADQRRVFQEVVECSNRLVAMSAKGKELLGEVYKVPEEKIVIIPHGIPDVPFVDPNFYKDQFGVTGRPVLLTFGLLSPGKGIEYAIRALPKIVGQHPDVMYFILGATHPNLLREQGETYRLSLERLARELGVGANVVFINRYVDNQELCEYIGVADIFIAPYLHEPQITSGALAYCFGSGKAVVATPFWHAAELLEENRGKLVPFRDSEAIASAVNDLLDEESKRHAMRKQAYLIGRSMIWPQVAHSYVNLFREARHLWQPCGSRAPITMTLAGGRADLPPWKLDHLFRLTDSTGMLQHASCTVPSFEHGYCADDNARALLLAMMLDDLGEEFSDIVRLQWVYASFLQDAFFPESGRFRNFMSFDRRWLEDKAGSEDSHGRALWGLGAVVGRTSNNSLREWAATLFEKALPAASAFASPRAWAFAVLGLHEYLRVLHGDLLANRSRVELSERLLEKFRGNAGGDWLWPENVVTYDNSRLPHALILAGRWMGNDAMRDTGLRSLRWLMDNQQGTNGCFRPVGCHGFWRRGQNPARLDQQPLEAAAAVGACIEAFNTTGDVRWRDDAIRAFEWFLGSNDLGLPLYDAATGGCCDGLQSNQVNKNQGAESTLSFLLALAEMRMLYNATATFGTNSPP